MGTFGGPTFGSGLFGGPGGGGGTGFTQVSEIIYGAYRNIGILGQPQRGYSPSEQQDGLEVLNTLLDGWMIDPLLIFTIRVDLYTLNPGQQTYLIGIDPTGQTQNIDFNSPRPVAIHRANIVTQIGGGQVTRIPMAVISVDRWSDIRVQATSSSIPQQLYDDFADPVSTLRLWPLPNAPAQLELYTWQQLPKFVSVNDAVLLPPGYLRALKSNLAIELAPRFPGPIRRAIVTPELVQIATNSLADIQRKNAPSPVLACDQALLGGKRLGWNFLVGE